MLLLLRTGGLKGAIVVTGFIVIFSLINSLIRKYFDKQKDYYKENYILDQQADRNSVDIKSEYHFNYLQSTTSFRNLSQCIIFFSTIYSFLLGITLTIDNVFLIALFIQHGNLLLSIIIVLMMYYCINGVIHLNNTGIYDPNSDEDNANTYLEELKSKYYSKVPIFFVILPFLIFKVLFGLDFFIPDIHKLTFCHNINTETKPYIAKSFW